MFEKPKPKPEPQVETDARDDVRVAEQIGIIQSVHSVATLDEIAKADKRPGVAQAIRHRRDELAEIRRAVEDAATAALARASGAGPKPLEGMAAQMEARRTAKASPPAGPSGRSCADCPHHISLPQSFSTVDCEKVRGERITVGTEKAEDCPHFPKK